VGHGCDGRGGDGHGGDGHGGEGHGGDGKGGDGHGGDGHGGDGHGHWHTEERYILQPIIALRRPISVLRFSLVPLPVDLKYSDWHLSRKFWFRTGVR